MQAALLGDKNIKRLVLIGSSACLKVIPQLITSLSALVDNSASIPDGLLQANDNIPEPFKTKINLAIKETGAQVMFNDFNACDKFDVMNQLADINIPVQIMVGEKDMMTPVKYASFLQDRLSNSELKIISAGTHMVFAEQAEIVNKHIQGFVERIIL
jgi:pimeloyl-ACP methyl ester carboxylesterase